MFLKLTFFLVFLTLIESNASEQVYSRIIERIKRTQVNNKQQTFTNNNFNPGNNFNNNGSPGNGGMTFTNNNFGPGVNNNGPMGGGGQTFTNNNFGMPGMNIVNNNGNGHPQSAPNMFANNNNGMAGAGMSMGMSMSNNVIYGMLSDNGDGTYTQPIYVNSEKGRKLIGYNIIANNKIIHTVFNHIVPGSDPAPLAAGPIPGPPAPPGPPGEKEEKKIKM